MPEISDYRNLEKEIADAPEPTVLPAGTEVKVRIVAVKSGVSDKNDCQWYMPIFEVPDRPEVMEFNKFMWELDKKKLTPKQYSRALYDFGQFTKAFGINLSKPFSWVNDLPGKHGWVILGTTKSDDYGEQNTVKKFVIKK